MKKNIFTLLIIIVLLLSSISLVGSFFYPTASFKGIKLRVGDFVAPSVITLKDEVIYTNLLEYIVYWDKVSDYNNYSNPVYYRFSINGKEYRTDQSSINLNLVDYLEREYIFKIKSCDQLNNCSKWSNERQLVIDKTAPEFNILINDFVVRETNFNNLIVYGDTNQTLEYLQIGSESSSNNLSQNYAQYIIINNSRLNYLSFDYLTFSNETLNGFDEVKLLVTINDKVVFYEDQVNNIGQWKKGLIDLSLFGQEELTIKFFSGNSGDNKLSSWSLVKNLTTNFILSGDYQDIVVQDKVNNEFLLTDLNNLGNKVEVIVSDLAGNNTSQEFSLIEGLVYSSDLIEIESSLAKLGFTF